MRRKYLYLILSFGFLTFGIWSCVDIPGGPSPSAFDFRALVRFIHTAAGKDTIAIFLSDDTSRDTIVNVTVNTSGSDTIIVRETIKITTTHTYYKRYEVNFASTLGINQDGSQIASLDYGTATTYRNTPAGNRKIQIIVDAPLIDTLDVHQIDSAKTTRFDTVGKGSSKIDTTITVKIYNSRIPSAVTTERIVADSTAPTLVVETDRKITVFFIHDVAPLVSSEGGRVRYGWLKFMKGDERYTFSPAIQTDSIGFRYINTSRNSESAGISLQSTCVLQLTNPDRDTTLRIFNDALGFMSMTRYNNSKYRDGKYNFYLLTGTTSIDSVKDLSLHGGRRYTVAVIDSNTTSRLRKFDDE